MPVNPKSLSNLIPGANKKNAVRVTLTLSPVTVELLKAQGNMSEAVDKLIQLCILGKVEHDGLLNPISPAGTEPSKLESDYADVSTETIASTDLKPEIEFHPMPPYWERINTASDLVRTGLMTTYGLKRIKDGDSFLDFKGERWWRIPITQTNHYLIPFGSPSIKAVYCK